jgi:hypothetical protein
MKLNGCYEKSMVAILINCCYGKQWLLCISMVAMEINGCYGKTKVAMKSKWLLLKVGGFYVCHWLLWKVTCCYGNKRLLWKVNGCNIGHCLLRKVTVVMERERLL